jgi:hypothetical protein
MKIRSVLLAARLACMPTFALADQAEDINAFALVLSIPVYADHCGVTVDEATQNNINAKIADMQTQMGLTDDQVNDFHKQMVEQFSANADCTEGSDDRTNFEKAIADYTAQ